VVNLGLLAVAKWFLVVRRRRVRVCHDFEIKDGCVEGFGRSKGADDDRGLERLLREEQLDGYVFLGLSLLLATLPFSSDIDHPHGIFSQSGRWPCRSP
jgi:hypothetical protein